MNLFEPQGYKYLGTGEVIPLIMLEDDSGGKVPLVRARIMQLGRDQSRESSSLIPGFAVL